ncbi:hypothetical protein JCM8202v2_004569 [Rhodotorula sphaerocarpa]
MEHSIHASHPHAAGHGAAHVTPRSEREHPIQDAPAEHLHHAHRHKHDPLREHSETPAEFRERHKKDAEAAENTLAHDEVHHYEGQLPAVATHAHHVLQNVSLSISSPA